MSLHLIFATIFASLFPVFAFASAGESHSISFAEIYIPPVETPEDISEENLIKNWSNLRTQTVDLSNIELEENTKELWIKLAKSASSVETMLVLQSRIIDKVKFWHFADGKKLDIGVAGPSGGYKNLNILTTSPIILLEQSADYKDVEVYLKVSSPYMKKLSIFSNRYSSVLVEMEISRFILYFFFGAFFLILLYQMILFYSFEFSASLWYSVFITCFALTSLLLQGVPDYFLAEHGGMHFYDLNWVLTAITCMFALIFFNSFMEFDKNDRVSKALLVLGFVGAFFQFIFGVLRISNPSQIENIILWKDISIGICSISVLATGAYAIYIKRPFARLALIAWMPLAIFVIADPLNWIPTGRAYQKVLPMVPILFEMVVMSIALSMKLSGFYSTAIHSLEQSKQNEFLKHILRALSHDMANHFFVAENYLKLGIMQERIPESLARLKKIQDSIHKTKELLARVRTWIQAGDRSLKFELDDIDALPILKQSVEIFEERAKLKGLEIVLNADFNSKYFIRAERVSLLNQIFNNLLSNAIKFSFKGSKILLSLDNEQTCIRFSIRDFGTGIPPHDLKDFNELGNIHSRQGTASESGTGFGMGLIKFYTAAFGASLEVKSSIATDNHGTEFIIKFVPSVEQSEKIEAAS